MSTAAIAETYYKAMGEKNIAEMEKLLHPDVHFIAPLAEVKGKTAFLETLKGFTAAFSALKVRAACGAHDQAMIAYNVEFPAPIGNCATAALLHFKEGLIAKIELFYDARALVK